MIIGCFVGSMLVRAIFHVRAVSMVAAPASVSALAVPHAGPQVGGDEGGDSEVSSLNAFVESRDSGLADIRSRADFAARVAGRRIHWSGTLETSWAPGAFKLAANESRGAPFIYLRPASSKAKSELRRIAAGTRVEIEGVVMDDNAVHLLSVRVVK
jgi:hypothetical protein